MKVKIEKKLTYNQLERALNKKQKELDLNISRNQDILKRELELKDAQIEKIRLIIKEDIEILRVYKGKISELQHKLDESDIYYKELYAIASKKEEAGLKFNARVEDKVKGLCSAVKTLSEIIDI
jgi:hypothetical protein